MPLEISKKLITLLMLLFAMDVSKPHPSARFNPKKVKGGDVKYDSYDLNNLPIQV